MPAPEPPVTASALPDYAKLVADKEAVLTFEKPAIPSVFLARRPLPLWSLYLAFLDGFLAFAALIGAIFSPEPLPATVAVDLVGHNASLPQQVQGHMHSPDRDSRQRGQRLVTR
jgi:hypothetical protein